MGENRGIMNRSGLTASERQSHCCNGVPCGGGTSADRIRLDSIRVALDTSAVHQSGRVMRRAHRPAHALSVDQAAGLGDIRVCAHRQSHACMDRIDSTRHPLSLAHRLMRCMRSTQVGCGM